MPLALAFGVASGAGPLAGLYGAIFAGFFAALLGGTPTQITGPTGPMTVVMAGVLASYANQPETAFAAVVAAGALQVVFGRLALGHYVTFVPYKVISGFMSGIGLVIICLQLGPLLGAEAHSRVPAALESLPADLAGLNWQELALGLGTLGLYGAVPPRIRRVVPVPLLALVIGIPVAGWWLTDAATLGAIPTALPKVIQPEFSLSAGAGVARAAILLALLGSIDSLLTSLVADNVSRSQHDSDRELVGQGVGNIVAGLFGGLPAAGATMRTVVNIRAGGRTRLSGMAHALVLATFLFGAAPLVQLVPNAVLAGILIKVGWDIIDWDYLRRLRTAPRGGVVVMLTVMFLTVFVDLITAVGVGIIMASLLSAKQMSEQQLASLKIIGSDEGITGLDEDEARLLREAGGRVLLLHLSGPFSFCSATGLIRRLTVAGSEYQALVIDLSDVTHIDESIAMAMNQLIDRCQSEGRSVHVGGAASAGARLLGKLRVLERVPAEQVHTDRRGAITQAVQRLTA